MSQNNLMILSLSLFIGCVVFSLLLFANNRSPSTRAALRLKTIIVRGSAENAQSPSNTPSLFLGNRSSYLITANLFVRSNIERIGGTRQSINILLLMAVFAFLAIWFVMTLDPFPPVLNVAFVLVCPSMAGFLLFNVLRRRWEIRFLNGFAEAIELVIRAFRSGIPVSEAIRVAGREISDPVRSEFRTISDALDLGIDLKDAMRAAADRVRLPDFDFLVTALVLQRETGGQLAETLENLSTILRKRKELRLKIKAITAEGRMSAIIVGMIPIVATLAMYFLDPHHIERLFVPGSGRTMLYCGVAFLAAGIAVTHLLTRIRP